MMKILFSILVMSFATSAYSASHFIDRWRCFDPFGGCVNYYTTPIAACLEYASVDANFDFTSLLGTYPNHQCDGTNSLGFQNIAGLTYSPIGCLVGETWNESTQTCSAEPEPCPPGTNPDPVTGLCFQQIDCSDTVGDTVQGNFQQFPAATAQCYSGCAYDPTVFNTSDGTSGYWTYTGNGSVCSPLNNPSPPPVPEPDPVPPITPTDPDQPVQDDGDSNPDPASDENQEVISQQLEGVQQQLQNLEQGSANETTATNNTNNLLTQLLNESLLSNSKGNGTGDGDGNGTDDVFGDGDCGAVPFCDGPAIECAIAQHAHDIKCNLQDETEDITEQEVMEQVGVTQTLEEYFDDTNPENIIDVGTYFSQPSITTASCPADYPVVTRFFTFSISLNYVCELGYKVRALVILGAFLTSALMFHSSLVRNF